METRKCYEATIYFVLNQLNKWVCHKLRERGKKH